jgi:hypothetical protein
VLEVRGEEPPRGLRAADGLAEEALPEEPPQTVLGGGEEGRQEKKEEMTGDGESIGLNTNEKAP